MSEGPDIMYGRCRINGAHCAVLRPVTTKGRVWLDLNRGTPDHATGDALIAGDILPDILSRIRSAGLVATPTLEIEDPDITIAEER